MGSPTGAEEPGYNIVPVVCACGTLRRQEHEHDGWYGKLTDSERSLTPCYFVQQNVTSSLLGLTSGLFGYCFSISGQMNGKRSSPILGWSGMGVCGITIDRWNISRLPTVLQIWLYIYLVWKYLRCLAKLFNDLARNNVLFLFIYNMSTPIITIFSANCKHNDGKNIIRMLVIAQTKTFITIALKVFNKTVAEFISNYVH